MEFGVQFFPDVRPEDKSPADYYRDCLEIAQQMQAVESAVANAKKTLVHDHIDHCLEHAVDGVGARDAISQFKAITKYL